MYTKGGFDLDSLKRKLVLKKEEGNFGFSLVCNSKRLGNYIKDVVPGSVAEKAGIKPGDRVIQIGETNIIGFQPIEIVKLLSNCENLLEMHVVEEKFYKAYLKQNEYPQISSPAYDEKNIDGSVFVGSSDEKMSTESTAAATAFNQAKMYDFETAAAITAMDAMTSTAATTTNRGTYRTLMPSTDRSAYVKKDLLTSAWIRLKSCFKPLRGAKHDKESSQSESYRRNTINTINFPTPKDEAVMTNTNVSVSSTESNEYGISNVRTKSDHHATTKSSKNPPTTSALSTKSASSKIHTVLTTTTSASNENVCERNKTLAEKSLGYNQQQTKKWGGVPMGVKKIHLPKQSRSTSKTVNSSKTTAPFEESNTKRNEVVIQFEHPKIIVLNSTERDIEV